MEDRDSRNHSVLHHACDHCSWSWRICYACEEIARDCHVDVINSCTIGYAKFYTPLMYVCDVAGIYAKERCRIANVLIGRLADVEVRDRLGNTPFLLAASGGYIPMLELLYVSGANIHAENDAGANAHSRCK